MNYRFALPSDAVLLAPFNLQLIRDEGHRNPMDVAQLTDRMRGWLQGDYSAVLFEKCDQVIGYALYRHGSQHVVLRQLFVSADHRRQGVARDALGWLWKNAWADVTVLRIEVLVNNLVARSFWSAAGFEEYSVTMEARKPA